MLSVPSGKFIVTSLKSYKNVVSINCASNNETDFKISLNQSVYSKNKSLIYLGAELSNNQLEAILVQEQSYFVTKKLFDYLKTKDFSESELTTKLLKAGFDLAIIQTQIAKFKENNYINDEEYVALLVNRYLVKHYGPYKIKDNLLNKKISETLIQAQMDNISEETIIQGANILAEKFLKNCNKSHFQAKLGLIRYLLSNGYSESMAQNIANSIKFYKDNALALAKDYAHFKHLYSAESKIINALMRKGYPIAQIKQIIMEEKDNENS